MAKQKKKVNKRYKPYPPLSKLDKSIYFIGQIVLCLCMLTSLLGYEWFAPYFVFKNDDVLAFDITENFFRIVPFWMLMVIVTFICLERLTGKKPLFGNKKIDYYNTTFYRFILPPFDKRYTERVFTKEKIKKTLIKFTIFALIFSLSGIWGFSGIISRWEVTDSAITKFGTFGKVEAVYSYDDIESYTVDSFSEKKSYKYSIWGPELGIEINLKNQEKLNMDLDLIKDEIYGLYKLDKALTGINKNINDRKLNDYIEHYNVSDEEIKLLYEIYEQ